MKWCRQSGLVTTSWVFSAWISSRSRSGVSPSQQRTVTLAMPRRRLSVAPEKFPESASRAAASGKRRSFASWSRANAVRGKRTIARLVRRSPSVAMSGTWYARDFPLAVGVATTTERRSRDAAWIASF